VQGGCHSPNTLTTMGGPKSGFPYCNLTYGNVTNNQYFLFEPDNPHQECTPYPSPGDVLGSSVDTALGTVTNNHCSGTDAIQHLSFPISCDIYSDKNVWSQSISVNKNKT